MGHQRPRGRLEEGTDAATSDDQFQFMVNIQRLLDEGLFTSSYKFALLPALADLSIEHANDSDSTLELATDAIAEKVVQKYWRQAMPYTKAGEAEILQQNTDRQAASLVWSKMPTRRTTTPLRPRSSIGRAGGACAAQLRFGPRLRVCNTSNKSNP